MKYYVYIIYNESYDKFYIGQTCDLNSRIFEHNHKLSNYTSRYDGQWILKYFEEYGTRREAMRREKFLKKQKNKAFYKKLCGMISSVG
jgi:putative endonuclease